MRDKTSSLLPPATRAASQAQNDTLVLPLPSDSLPAARYCDSLYILLRQSGYLQATLLRPQAATGNYSLCAGPRYQLGNVIGPYGPIDSVAPRPLSAQNIQAIAALYAMRFADSLRPDDLLTVQLIPRDQGTATAKISILPSKTRPTLLGLELHGDCPISKAALCSFLSLELGQPIPKDFKAYLKAALASLPFLTQLRVPSIEYLPKGIRLHLYPTSRRANTAQGSLAMTPAPTGEKGVRFEGQVDLQLVNLLHQGEQLALTWQLVQNVQMDLALQARYPHIAHWPLGAQADIIWQKRDTSELRFVASLGVTLHFQRFHALTLGYEFLRANYFAPEATSRKISTKGNSLSLGYQYARMRYDLPWPLTRTLSIGTSYTLRTQAGYDNSQLLRAESHLVWDWQLPWYSLRTGLRGDYYYQSFTRGPRLQGVLEQFQLGGASSLRGYREQALHTTHALILSGNFGWYANGYLAPSIFLDATVLLDRIPVAYILSPGASAAFQVSNFALQLALAKAFPLGQGPTLNSWMVHLRAHLRF